MEININVTIGLSAAAERILSGLLGSREQTGLPLYTYDDAAGLPVQGDYVADEPKVQEQQAQPREQSQEPAKGEYAAIEDDDIRAAIEECRVRNFGADYKASEDVEVKSRNRELSKYIRGIAKQISNGDFKPTELPQMYRPEFIDLLRMVVWDDNEKQFVKDIKQIF